jgi:hypothetical protein
MPDRKLLYHVNNAILDQELAYAEASWEGIDGKTIDWFDTTIPEKSARKFLISLEQYAIGGAKRVDLKEDGWPYLTLSTNISNSPAWVAHNESNKLPDGFFYMKDWSENAWTVGQLVAQGKIRYSLAFESTPSGFVTVRVAYFVRGQLK